MARLQHTIEQPIPVPVTSMPGCREPMPQPERPKGHPVMAEPPRVGINMERLLSHIATVGEPEDASPLEDLWRWVNATLAQFGQRGNGRAVKELPTTTANFNDTELRRWKRGVTEQDIGDLHKVYAAARLRIRHARSLNRKKKKG
jgi:hypothetical protein